MIEISTDWHRGCKSIALYCLWPSYIVITESFGNCFKTFSFLKLMYFKLLQIQYTKQLTLGKLWGQPSQLQSSLATFAAYEAAERHKDAETEVSNNIGVAHCHAVDCTVSLPT